MISTAIAVVLETILLKLFYQVIVSINDLTYRVDPLVTLFTHYPLLSIDVSILSIVNVNLLAEITKLVIFVSIAAWFTKPEEFTLTKLSS